MRASPLRSWMVDARVRLRPREEDAKERGTEETLAL